MEEPTSTSSQFTISRKDFEGPLTLLIQLIEKRKVAITDFSLSEITDEYIQFLHEHPHSISENSEFIHTASVLLLIKSKALLPNLELTTKEEADISELEERLSQYQKIQNVAQKIRPLLVEQSSFRSNFKPEEVIIFMPDTQVQTGTLTQAIRNLLQQLPAIQKETKVKLRHVVSLKEMIESILTRVRATTRTSFTECTKGFTEKADIVVSFLAMLELAKEQDILVSQNNQYGTIDIESPTVQTPQVMHI
jgi:segregation and condensation protein A